MVVSGRTIEARLSLIVSVEKKYGGAEFRYGKSELKKKLSHEMRPAVPTWKLPELLQPRPTPQL